MRGRGGFALVGALWLLVVLSAVALDFGLRGRDRRASVLNRVEEERAAHLAQAGLERARAAFVRRAGADASGIGRAGLDPWRDPEALVPEAASLGGDGGYTLRAADAGALLNVRRIDEAALRRFLEALAVDAGAADRLSQAVADWTDPDALRRGRGGEGAEYLAAGAPILPPDRPLRSVGELRRVAGMTDEIFRRVEPLVTVSGTGRVNLSSAPAPVLRALPGMSEALLGEILERRRRGTLPGSIAELGVDLPPAERALLHRYVPELVSRTTMDTREVIVESEGWLAGSGTRVRMAGVLVRSGGSVFLVDRRRLP